MLIISLLVIGTPPKEKHLSDLEKIATAIHEFASAADQRDLKKMDQVLHKDYRSVVNRLFGSKEVSIMDKALYLDLLKQEKIGGDQRTVEINSIDMIGNNAVAQVTLNGKELIFLTFIQLVKDTNDQWLVISDMPKIDKKE